MSKDYRIELNVTEIDQQTQSCIQILSNTASCSESSIRHWSDIEEGCQRSKYSINDLIEVLLGSIDADLAEDILCTVLDLQRRVTIEISPRPEPEDYDNDYDDNKDSSAFR